MNRRMSLIAATLMFAVGGLSAAQDPTPPIPSKQMPEIKPPEPGPSSTTFKPDPVVKPDPPVPPFEILFVYGSEKRKWVEAVTEVFNKSGRKLPSGEPVKVVTKAMGSGEIIQGLLTEGDKTLKAHVVSPASGAFLEIGNAQSREKTPDNRDLVVGPPRGLVSSPIVVMIWREAAEGMGWLAKAPSWKEVFAAAGQIKLGHTNPDQSNSGLHALLAEGFAAVDKFQGIARADFDDLEKVGNYLRKVEAAVPYYETSTGFLAERMVKEGPEKLTAAIVYENSVIDANKAARTGGNPRVVAIYPSEGTFPSEHPIAVVFRDWVTDKHKAAAGLYIEFLLEGAQQLKAKEFGFRPSDLSIDVADILRPELGVDPKPAVVLMQPPASVIQILLDLWEKNKNPAAGPALGR